MKFLITGMAGFIGSHLADRLVREGHTVDGVDNLTTGNLDNLSGGLTIRRLDIAKRLALYEFANRVEPDVVIHCAASYSDPNLWHRDTDTNVTGTINATLIAKHHGARLVYFQTALPPISSYAISKIAGEHYIKLSGVPALIFRLANIYGPRNLSGPIPTFYKRLTAREPCTVTDTRRDTVYIADLVNLVSEAIDEKASGKFDVCSGTAYPIRRYYDAVASTLGNTGEPDMVPRGADDIMEMELSPAAAGYEFGWIASTSLEDGIAETIDWYRKHGVAETYTHLQLTKAG